MNKRSLIGVVAGVYISGFVGAITGSLSGLYLGMAILGLDRAYIGCVIGAVIGMAICVMEGTIVARFVGAITVGTSVVVGIHLGDQLGGILGALASGIVLGVIGTSKANFHATPKGVIFYGVVMWTVIGLIGGLFALTLMEMLTSMEL